MRPLHIRESPRIHAQTSYNCRFTATGAGTHGRADKNAQTSVGRLAVRCAAMPPRKKSRKTDAAAEDDFIKNSLLAERRSSRPNCRLIAKLLDGVQREQLKTDVLQQAMCTAVQHSNVAALEEVLSPRFCEWHGPGRPCGDLRRQNPCL